MFTEQWKTMGKTGLNDQDLAVSLGIRSLDGVAETSSASRGSSKGRQVVAK